MPNRDQRFGKRGYLGAHEARVVYLENARRIHVVTVEWVGEKPEKKKEKEEGK